MTKVLTVRFKNSSGRYSYASSKTYDYLYDGSKMVEKDDIAVVNSPYSDWTCTVVVGVRDKTSFDVGLKSVSEVVCLSEERRAKAIAAEKAKIVKQLKKLAEKESELFLFEQVASKNPEAADLLKQLKALG